MEATHTKRIVVGVFGDLQRAQNSIRELRKEGFPRESISLIAHRNDISDSSLDIASGSPGHEPAMDKAADIAGDAGVGAAIGGMGGLLIGLAGLTIPGIGPIIAAGPIAAMLGGMGVGAAAGGMVGALAEAGVSKEEALAYSEGVRRGDVLVTVKTSSDEAANRARDILDRHDALDVDRRVESWRDRGWTGHNPGAEPLSADEIRREREYYGLTPEQGSEWDNLTERALTEADPALEVKTQWPHRDAHDVAECLQASRRARIYPG